MSKRSGKRLFNRLADAPMSRRRALGVTAAGAVAAGLGLDAGHVDAEATPTAAVAGWPSEMPDYASFAAAVQGEAARWNIPGVAAAMVHNGERTTAVAGVASLEYPGAVTPETRFQIGSVSKVFTATAVMALVDQGLLDLDTPVGEWIPDLPLQRADDFADLSLRHLLNHTTGFEGDYYFDMGEGDDALAAGISRFGEMRVWTHPGEVISYCNTGFSLAGHIIELATGTTYEDAVNELIFAPLGMDHSSFPSSDIATWPTASGHSLPSREDGHLVHRPWALPRFLNSAGGIVSTADDLLTFAEMHMADGAMGTARVLSEDAAREMRVRTAESDAIDEGYGVSWNIMHAGGTALVGHGGATNGFRAWLIVVPEHQYALAVLTNSDEGLRVADAVEQWALRHELGIEREDPEVTASDPAALDTWTGRYERHDAIIDIWRVDDHLHLEHQAVELDEPFSEQETADAPPAPMDFWPAGETVFVAPGGPPLEGLIEFIPDVPLFGEGDELVPRQLLRRGGRIAERTGDAPASGPTVVD